MARIDNLNNFLSDVAAAIKEKTGLTAITPAEFDTAINGISTGIEPIGTTKNYYVYQGQTITEGQFIELVDGVSTMETGNTPWNMIADGTRAMSWSTLWLTDDNLIVFWEDNNNKFWLTLCKMNGPVITRTITSLFAAFASGEALPLGNMYKISSNEFYICYGGNVSYMRLEGETFFEGERTELHSGCLTKPPITIGNAGGTVANIMYGQSSASSYKVWCERGIYADSSDNYSIRNNGSNMVAYSSSATFIASYDLSLQAACTANDRIIVFAKIGSGTKTVNDASCAAGWYAMNLPMTNDSNSSYGWGSITQLSTSGNYKFMFAANNPSYGWGLKAVDSATSGYQDLQAFKITTGTTTISMTTSIVKLIDAQLDDISTFIFAPISSTQFVIMWQADYIPTGGYRGPWFAKVVTQSSSGFTHGTTLTLSQPYRFNDEGDYIPNITVLNGNKVMLTTNAYSNDSLRVKMLKISGNTISETDTYPLLETQAKIATTANVNGLAKTSGTGGSATTHAEQVTVYVPNV